MVYMGFVKTKTARADRARMVKWVTLMPFKVKKADVSSVSPSSERMEELWVVCGFIWRKWSYAIGGNIATRKT